MREIPQWEFDFYALSRPRGHDFGASSPVAAWAGDDGRGCGIVTRHATSGSFGLMILRRRIDRVWTLTREADGFASIPDAAKELEPALAADRPLEPLPPGAVLRPSLFDFGDREPSDVFRLLAGMTHRPAAWALEQLYLALPKPDRNWVSDCQTINFHTRLWEAHLLASFREQGLFVDQPFESPDFRIENAAGGEAWVEAVTANPPTPYNHVNAPFAETPTERDEIFFGGAALRFAKTIGNKLARRYDQLPHVTGKPFILAVADFQASGSMLWSREGLIGYLHGTGATLAEVNGQPQAVPLAASHLLGPARFPAGLFADDRHAELSAIIFSNACSMAKLNRVAISGGGAPEGYRYTRIGKFFDRTPGALEGHPFCLDITSAEYRGLWPHGYEPWTAEMEVFHNPHARHPISLDLFPEATHWIEQDGEWMCSSAYESSILWSQTLITGIDKPPPSLEDFISGVTTRAV
ncbi:hypothetical protein [Brucella anthropi]|uniref:hypothetical protein n=1 Tax=Brucella anthropi TaxID=529 RepID=UPI00124D1607|nr:hypothetical protein [Brucella anthropi]KAB2726516.1 hypothetical protein F9K76_07380 [Brucella anthropi]KAB2743678.1 hypothetical protein F9K74_07325 [Brucella anthropi]KAB2804425.1 hypothetical protein F9K83_07325 [Brucella anthropi]